MLLPSSKRTPTSKVLWEAVSDLGKVPDSEIARRYSVSQTAVLLARGRRGIPPFKTVNRYTIDWDSVPLGKYVDEHIADMLECSKVLVWKERNRRGIPPYGMAYRTVENEGAYYEEAIIDLWLHNQGIAHEFQKHIGSYRVDWLLADNVVWEYLGMWDHQTLGGSYRSNYWRKLRYLKSKGYSVRGIHRREIPSFKSNVDLSALLSMGIFECRGCSRRDVKHASHALCAACNHRIRKGKELGPIQRRLRPEDSFVCESCQSTDRHKRVHSLCRICYNRSYKEDCRNG